MRESYTDPLVLIERYITSKFRTMRLVYIEPFPSYYILILLFFIDFYFILLVCYYLILF